MSTIDARAEALLNKLVAIRKDDGQGVSVEVQSGTDKVALSITAKPSSGWRGAAGGAGGAEPEGRSVAEVEAVMKATGMKPSEWKVWASDDGKRVYASWPYAKKDEPSLKALGMRWDPAEKASWAPLKAVPSP